jgi:hypothetical protein
MAQLDQMRGRRQAAAPVAGTDRRDVRLEVADGVDEYRRDAHPS